MYDAQILPTLEGDARATGQYLARTLADAQKHQAAFLAKFDMLTATPAEANHYQAIERLVSGVQGYVDAMIAYTTQLEANLTEAEREAHRQGQRADIFLQEFKMAHADYLREQQFQIGQANAFQTILGRA